MKQKEYTTKIVSPKILIMVLLVAVSIFGISKTAHALEGNNYHKVAQAQQDQQQDTQQDPKNEVEPISRADDRCKDGADCLNSLYGDYINPGIKALSILVGVIVVIMIIVGGIQYSSAESDPNKIAAAKNKIRNAIIALLAYFLLFALLQWLVPGGVV